MFAKRSNQSFIVGAALLSLGVAGLAGCDTGREAEVGVVGEENTQAQVQQGEAAEGENVVSETITPTQEEANIGQTEVEQGEADVAVRRRVVTTELEQLQVPTVQVCQEYADLNRMEARHFVALGVPQESADRIIQYREQQGQFQSEDQLSQIQGLDQNAISKIQEVAEVNPEQAQQQQQQRQAE